MKAKTVTTRCWAEASPSAPAPAVSPPAKPCGRSSAPLGPMFCRSRHGCAAPGPQRQNPGACRRSAPFRCAKPRWPVVAPAGGNVLATPFSLCSNVAPHIPAGSAGVRSFVPRLAPRSHPGARRLPPPFCFAKTRGRSSAPPGPMFWPTTLSLRSSVAPRPKPRRLTFYRGML